MLSEAIPFAFAAALYPPALLMIAYLMSRDQPLRRALTFLAGAALLTLTVGGVAVVVLRGSGADSSSHSSAPPALDVALGVALLVFAVVSARRPPRPKRADTGERRPMSLRRTFLLGVAMYIPSAFYLSALHALAQGKQSTAVTVGYVILVGAIVLCLVELPIVLYAVAPERTGQILGASNAWIGRNGRRIVVVLASVIGAYLLGKGVAGLA